MNIQVNQKLIQDMCGTVSFKRGKAIKSADQVTFTAYDSDRCEAIVSGAENFHVVVERDSNGRFTTSCSCPKLASFKKECQHVAAVLLAIQERQRRKKTASIGMDPLSEGMLSLFINDRTKPSAHQSYFEDRQELPVSFTCTHQADSNALALEIEVESVPIANIKEFLSHVKDGKRVSLSNGFLYNPSLHCFSEDADAVIQALIQIVNGKFGEPRLRGEASLLIPPGAWDQLLPLLLKIPESVSLSYSGRHYPKLVPGGRLPLSFELYEGNRAFRLKMAGIKKLVVLPEYVTVLADGSIHLLAEEDCRRLAELTRMLAETGTEEIPIQRSQADFFLEKVIPGLKRLGDVSVSDGLARRLERPRLVAKLYLDRVKNRLLASLEFEYGHIVIDPLSLSGEPGHFLIRDMRKEEQIMELIDESSFTKTEGGFYLHNEALEYDFLLHRLPKLQKLVQVYATTAVRNRIFKGNPKPRIRVKMKKERTDWLEFKVSMDGIPDENIRELLEALEEKRKYYRLRDGSLLSLETREFEEIQRFLNEVPEQDTDWEAGLNVPIVRGLRLLDKAGEDTFTFEQSFRDFLEAIKEPDGQDHQVPESLDGIMREYQKQGYRWLKTLASYGFGGILADDMGLGKTIQSIAFLLSELETIRESKQPALIVCPSSLTYNWLGELMKFAPEIEAVVIDGTRAERNELMSEAEAAGIDVIITSYHLLRADISMYEKRQFHTVFFDEAQAFKNPLTQTAKTVKRIKAGHSFALTGTPVENAPEELWSIFHVVFPELFLGLKEFSQLNRKSIAKRSSLFMLRRVKEDVLHELPKKTENLDIVELLPEQKKLYAAYLAKLRHDTFKHLDKETIRKNRIRILAGLTRLRQICCHPALFVDGYEGTSAKYEQLKKIIEQSRIAGRRVLIFSQFTKMLGIIGRHLSNEGIPFFYLDGNTPSEERVETCRKFNAGERDIFLISLKAGGTGLNLTGADTVILYDVWWNPAVEEQAADRAHRLGQKKAVQVLKLITKGTIEEKMNQLQEKKKNLIEEIISPGKDDSFALTEEDIREILMD